MNGVIAITHIDNKTLEDLLTYSIIKLKNVHILVKMEIGKIVLTPLTAIIAIH